MAWKETCAVEERLRFVLAVRAEEEPFSMTCRRFGVSRANGYKWMARYGALGVEGLKERSRAPHSHPHEVSPEVVEQCLAVRGAHPTWGPVKVKAWLERRYADQVWPAASTIGVLFDAAQLTVKRKVRRRVPPSSAPFGDCADPNAVWCIDWKGWFLTGDGTHCEPLTLCDAASRYLLRCQVLARTDAEHVWPILDVALREFGVPERIKSDNGPPFASRGAGGLSKLSVKLVKAGIAPERSRPGKPQDNGRLERLHLTLLQDTASPPERSLRAQLERFAEFRRIYNEERPHAALGDLTPADVYRASPRRWDGILREPEYRADHEVRRVRQNGEIKWRGEFVYLNTALYGEPVGLVETDTGWTAWYGPVLLGLVDPRTSRLRKPNPRRAAVDNPAGLPTAQPPQPTNNDGNEAGSVSPMFPV